MGVNPGSGGSVAILVPLVKGAVLRGPRRPHPRRRAGWLSGLVVIVGVGVLGVWG